MMKNVKYIKKLIMEGSTRAPNYVLAKKLVAKYTEESEQYALEGKFDLAIKCQEDAKKMEELVLVFYNELLNRRSQSGASGSYYYTTRKD